MAHNFGSAAIDIELVSVLFICLNPKDRKSWLDHLYCEVFNSGIAKNEIAHRM